MSLNHDAVSTSPVIVLDYQELKQDKTSPALAKKIEEARSLNVAGNSERYVAFGAACFLQAFGFDGLGILAVSGVPEFPESRARCLPFAYKFANLPGERQVIVI
jgi:hypothetical protein